MRLNAVLIISKRVNYLKDAQEWLRKIDAVANESDRRPEVCPLQNRAAPELQPILDALSGTNPEELDGDLRIVADQARNSIIVWGNSEEKARFQGLIGRLDTVPVQVLLEVTIAEVLLDDELKFGLRWFFEGGNWTRALTDSG